MSNQKECLNRLRRSRINDLPGTLIMIKISCLGIGVMFGVLLCGIVALFVQ